MKVLGYKRQLDEAGASVVFVTFDDPEPVRRALLAGLEVPYPVLVDRERVAYRAWGLRRSSVAGIWLDPRVWWRYASLVVRGERLRTLGSDTLQLGGDFVLDGDGIVIYARPQRRDDRPPVGELLRALRSAARVEPPR
ncbi:MAG: AhpC/TSA family protein [Thermoleophilia bacterium]|nr:AhpC/TSA family protein [Thermoleophilia bacterium]